MFELKTLSVYQLNIPFHFAFKPALDDKNVSQVFWIRADAGNGINGFGEFRINKDSSLRSIEEANRFIDEYREQWSKTIHNLDSLITWITNNKKVIDAAPEVFAAVEFALLDAIAQYHKTSIEKLLGIEKQSREINEIAVLNKSKLEKFMLQFSLYEQNTPRGFKIALDGQYSTDSLKSSFLLNSDSRIISFNANKLWDTPESLMRYINALPVNPYYIENPLSDSNQEAIIALSHHIKSRIIIDHTCLITHNSKTCTDHKDSFIINLRVPKMGGLIRTLNIIQYAGKTGLNIIIGENTGETSLSIKASQIAAYAAKNKLLFQETIYSIYMLNEDLYKLSITHDIDHNEKNVTTLNVAEQITSYITQVH